MENGQKILLIFMVTIFAVSGVYAQNSGFNGAFTHLNNLFMLSNAKTRSISPENLTGEKGKGGMATLK
ncbi:MAG TPA: hypothetical protein ENG82_01885, partial [Bacteroidetes bacterium]|nr:hypothetical protein [Bacteroidota bacterium]